MLHYSHQDQEDQHGLSCIRASAYAIPIEGFVKLFVKGFIHKRMNTAGQTCENCLEKTACDERYVKLITHKFNGPKISIEV